MCSSLSTCSLLLPSSSRFLHPPPSWKHSSAPFLIRNRRSPRFFISASTAEKNVGLSWEGSSESDGFGAYNGWVVVEEPVFKEISKGLPTFVKISTWASLAALLGAAAYFSLHLKGLKIQFTSPSNCMQDYSVLNAQDKEPIEIDYLRSDEPFEDDEAVDANRENDLGTFGQNVAADPNNMTTQGELHRIIIPFAADSTQKDALVVLKKLEIIEDEVKAEGLCTRREYAIWLVRASTRLERKTKHKIVSSIALAGSTAAAFDDVLIEDPDFLAIQTLAESGILPSKLSLERPPSGLNDSGGHNGVNFFPDRYISRQDLISWKAKLEYDIMPEVDEEISRRKIGFLDVRDIAPEVLVDIFVDALANERSIARNAFGQSNRFQPKKPCTNAQAAVALTSGKMREYTQSELRKLEEERSSRLETMEKIKQELVDRGEIQRFWQNKMEEEKCLSQEANTAYLAALKDLDRAKVDMESARVELVKQKAALDCQKQMLSSIEKEVEEMSGTLASQGPICLEEERRDLQVVLGDLQDEYDHKRDSKSVLEAEVEALRILRSWIESEAIKSQVRAKVLEEAGRRWKWEGN
ncbi:hypothetical protein DM860_008319 [Cuscuta australis]|uniref:SLH domain-containing protein n=1 Tax=Cuscuta australis TaxID=267555 RepID=A0A328D751_9ASTE|nr:hypothetical protein DM860_008319 [Cuscuta australis]